MQSYYLLGDFMDDLKKLGFSYLYTNISILVVLLVITFLSIINFTSSKSTSILELISIILCLFVNSFLLGKKTSNKGYLEGLKLGFSISITYLLLSILVFNYNLNFKSILFYILIVIISMFGSMIGINKRLDSK